MEAMLRYHYKYQLPTTTASPTTLTDGEVGEESRVEEPQKTQSHSHSSSVRSRPVILGGITNRMQGLNLISLLFMVIYNTHLIIYSINQITLET